MGNPPSWQGLPLVSVLGVLLLNLILSGCGGERYMSAPTPAPTDTSSAALGQGPALSELGCLANFTIVPATSTPTISKAEAESHEAEIRSIATQEGVLGKLVEARYITITDDIQQLVNREAWLLIFEWTPSGAQAADTPAPSDGLDYRYFSLIDAHTGDLLQSCGSLALVQP